MSNEPYDKRTLIQYRLEQAHNTLQDAQSLIEKGGSPVSIINRSYYAMFYAVLALLITIGKGTSKHSGAIALFDENFIKTNLFPKEMGKLLHRAFDMREKGDYSDMVVVTIDEAMDVFNSAIEFVKNVKEKLSNQL
jgi:uncharacterized protein (UPF0332 family)